MKPCMMRPLALGLSLCLLAGCGSAASSGTAASSAASSEASSAEPTPEATGEYTRLFSDVRELPCMDGSTACQPLIADTIAATCGISREEAETYVNTNKTSYAWQMLMDGSNDIVFAYEMPDSVKEYWETEMPTELEIAPIGLDALVFMVNEQNPVQSLTQDQLRSIYRADDPVTNWKDLGGEDAPIAAFQRDASSGSQTLFKKLLMGDVPLADAPTELRPGMMNMLVEALASYNNEGNAIGYSVYYYISEMYSQPGLRLLGVDGVTPGFDTIQSGSYPLTNSFYVAIRADEPENSAARRLFNWIQSDEGTACLIQGGYVPAAAAA